MDRHQIRTAYRYIVPRATNVPATGGSIIPVMAFTDLRAYHHLLFAFFNVSNNPAGLITITIKTSEWRDVKAVDQERIYTLDVPPAVGTEMSQRTLEIGPEQMRAFWQVEAVCPGVPNMTMAWQLRGAMR